MPVVGSLADLPLFCHPCPRVLPFASEFSGSVLPFASASLRSAIRVPVFYQLPLSVLGVFCHPPPPPCVLPSASLSRPSVPRIATESELEPAPTRIYHCMEIIAWHPHKHSSWSWSGALCHSAHQLRGRVGGGGERGGEREWGEQREWGGRERGEGGWDRRMEREWVTSVQPESLEAQAASLG